MASTTTSLAKKIGFWSATSMVIGTIIGSGVFMKPASMAAQLGSPVWLTLTWIIAGIFTLFGALIYAELGAMFPETGGLYAYFKKIFGDFFAFLFGWSAFAVINTASTAAIAYVCAKYGGHFLQLPQFSNETIQSVAWHIPFIGDLYPLQDAGVKGLAITIIILLSWLNSRSVKAGNYFQVISTLVKVVIIGLLIFGIFLSGNGSIQNFVQAENPKQGSDLLNGFIMAMTGAFFAYDGWVNVTYIAGEIKEPQRNIPRSLIVGVFTCIAVYVLINQAYLYVLPVEQVAGSSLVAADAMQVAFGNIGSAVIAALIVICTLGGINGNVFSTCRVTYAMSKDRLFAQWAGEEHKKFATPANALWLHCIWTCLFIMTGTFDMLADMFVFITWIAYGAGAIGIFMLRKKMPDQPRPYKIGGHPVVTILFIGFTVFYLVITLVNDITNYINDRQPVINSLLGLIITGLGIPLYFFYRRKRKRSDHLTDQTPQH